MPKIKVSTLVHIKRVSEKLTIEHNSLNLLTQQQIHVFPVTQGVDMTLMTGLLHILVVRIASISHLKKHSLVLRSTLLFSMENIMVQR